MTDYRHAGRQTLARVWYQPHQMGYALYIGQREPATNRTWQAKLVFSPVEPGVFSEPAALLDEAELQVLMDSLWDAGVRPRSVGSAGHLAATESHLKDMQKLVFDRLLPVIERGRK